MDCDNIYALKDLVVGLKIVMSDPGLSGSNYKKADEVVSLALDYLKMIIS